jgi:hypothetical protein
MSGNKTSSRFRTWHFSHTLYTCVKPDAARGLGLTSSIDPWKFIKSMFDDSELFKLGPPTVVYIHLRVSRAAFDRCVACGRSGTALPNLPFTGFIQASNAVHLSRLQEWLDGGWTPSGLLSVLSCVPLHNTGTNSWTPPMLPRGCISLFAGNLPSRKAEGKDASPMFPR